MTTTYVHFAAQCRAELQEATDGVWTDESIRTWTNEAGDDFATRTKCLEDEVYADSVPDQQSYDLPDYTLEPKAVYYDGVPLQREDFADWYSLNGTGTPRGYTWSSNTLYLRPIPVVAGSVRVFRYRTPDPAATADFTGGMPFNGRFDNALRAYVKARAFEQIGDWDSYKACVDNYERAVNNAVNQQAIESQLGRHLAPVEVY